MKYKAHYQIRVDSPPLAKEEGVYLFDFKHMRYIFQFDKPEINEGYMTTWGFLKIDLKEQKVYWDHSADTRSDAAWHAWDCDGNDVEDEEDPDRATQAMIVHAYATWLLTEQIGL